MPQAPSLSRTEWQAVRIALNDAAACGCVETPREGWRARIARLWILLTGNEPARPLADPRLEALRRFVCATRRLHRPAERHVPALVALGFNRAQVDAIALLSA